MAVKNLSPSVLRRAFDTWRLTAEPGLGFALAGASAAATRTRAVRPTATVSPNLFIMTLMMQSGSKKFCGLRRQRSALQVFLRGFQQVPDLQRCCAASPVGTDRAGRRPVSDEVEPGFGEHAGALHPDSTARF